MSTGNLGAGGETKAEVQCGVEEDTAGEALRESSRARRGQMAVQDPGGGSKTSVYVLHAQSLPYSSFFCYNSFKAFL